MTQLPEDFIRETKQIMGEERFSRYLSAFDKDAPTSIRLNPLNYNLSTINYPSFLGVQRVSTSQVAPSLPSIPFSMQVATTSRKPPPCSSPTSSAHNYPLSTQPSTFALPLVASLPPSVAFFPQTACSSATNPSLIVRRFS